ncbi:hypothetical protein Bbelb_129010 [Branchiostoma belcheri]|nr:hypothetical protein Bbelb_129010 [Branchiostoma belcheri]
MPGETHARPIVGEEREGLKEVLKFKPVRRERLDRLARLPEESYQSGCRDTVSSLTVLKKIKSEGRSLPGKPEPHPLLEIHKRQQEQSIQKKVPGIVQRFLLVPPTVMLWSEETVRIWHMRTRANIAYLDATGGVLTKTNGRRPYYVYELVVRNEKKGAAPFPCATLLTTDHTAPHIRYFLHTFRHSEAKIFGYNNVSSVPLFIVDGSVILMSSVVSVFAGETLTVHLDRCFRIEHCTYLLCHLRAGGMEDTCGVMTPVTLTSPQIIQAPIKLH